MYFLYKLHVYLALKTYNLKCLVTDYKCTLIVDEFREKIGIERVVEALQCAEWPNMKMTGTNNNVYK